MSAFSGVDHVIPRTLGTFDDNFTLDCVCDNCNHTLGSSVEWVLAHGSLEAVLAIQYGVRTAADAARLLRDRVSLEFPEGDYKGLRLTFFERDGELVIAPVPQVGLARRDEPGFRFFTERELSALRGIPDDVDPNGERRIIAMLEGDDERLIVLLRHRGIAYQHVGHLPVPHGWGKVQAELNFTMDVMVRRCVAKIAFNYMAYVVTHIAEAQDFAFVYRRDFDAIRNFVRYGTTPAYRLVVESESPILHDDTLRRRQTNGHIVTLEWAESGTDLMSQVSPFNHITYKVSLARSYSGILRSMRYGHLFDIEVRRISPLLGMDRTRLVLP